MGGGVFAVFGFSPKFPFEVVGLEVLLLDFIGDINVKSHLEHQ